MRAAAANAGADGSTCEWSVSVSLRRSPDGSSPRSFKPLLLVRRSPAKLSRVRRAQFLDGEQKRSLELLLGLLIKLRAPNREIKHVDRDLSFGIDQSNLNVAIVSGQSGRDLAQQAGAILSHYLQQGAVRGGSVIEIQPGRYPDHDGTTQRLTAQQHFDRCLQRDHIQETRAGAVHFRRVELKSATGIAKLKGVDNNSGVIGKRLCLDDVHAPRRKSSGHVRKQQRPVA